MCDYPDCPQSLAAVELATEWQTVCEAAVKTLQWIPASWATGKVQCGEIPMRRLRTARPSPNRCFFRTFIINTLP